MLELYGKYMLCVYVLSMFKRNLFFKISFYSRRFFWWNCEIYKNRNVHAENIALKKKKKKKLWKSLMIPLI